MFKWLCKSVTDWLLISNFVKSRFCNLVLKPSFANSFGSSSLYDLNHPFTIYWCSCQDGEWYLCLWQHGINLSPKFSEECAHQHWHDWSVTAKQFKLARRNTENGRGNGIVCKMWGSCLETTCEDRKRHNTGRQDLTEGIEGKGTARLLLYHAHLILKEVIAGRKGEKTKVGRKDLDDAHVGPHIPLTPCKLGN